MNESKVTGALHLKATVHYHANRFELAANEFRNAINNNSISNPNYINKENSHRLPINDYKHRFHILSKVALEADEALSKFRSCVSKLDDSPSSLSLQSECFTLLSKARQANEMYTNELEGSLKSIINEEEFESQTSKKKFLISKERVDLALAFLITGVSGLWLHIHSIRNNETSIFVDDRKKAKVILCKAIRLAGYCFIQSKGLFNYTPTWQECLAIIHDIESLQPENIVLRAESERMSFVLASLRHALNIIDLSSPLSTLVNSSIENRKRKRKKIAVIETEPSNRDESSKKIKPNLGIQEIITKALWHRQRIRYCNWKQDNTSTSFHREECKKYLNQAVGIDWSIISKRLSSMIEISNILGAADDCEKKIGNWYRIAMELEELRSKCPLISLLLGCIYSKIGNAQKGLLHLQTSLELDDKEEYTALILSNIAICYVMLGHPKPCLELLLQKYSISNEMKENEKNILKTSFGLLEQYKLKYQNSEESFLWQIYFSSILVGDSATCFDCIKQFNGKKIDHQCIEIASVFACSKLGRLNEVPPSIVNKKQDEQASLISNLHYVAVVVNIVEFFVKNENLVQTLEWSKNCLKAVKDLSLIKMPKNIKQFLSMLRACVFNNYALCLILHGKNLEALSYMQEATDSINSCSFQTETDVNFSKPYFNMVILLIRMGLYSHAASIWSSLRKLKRTSCALENDFEAKNQFDKLNSKITYFENINNIIDV